MDWQNVFYFERFRSWEAMGQGRDAFDDVRLPRRSTKPNATIHALGAAQFWSLIEIQTRQSGDVLKPFTYFQPGQKPLLRSAATVDE